MPSLNILDREPLHCLPLERLPFCNMGAEVGATTSLFPYDERMGTYLKATGREEVAKIGRFRSCRPSRRRQKCLANPEKYYDRIIEIDLSLLEPYIKRALYAGCSNTDIRNLPKQ